MVTSTPWCTRAFRTSAVSLTSFELKTLRIAQHLPRQPASFAKVCGTSLSRTPALAAQCRLGLRSRRRCLWPAKVGQEHHISRFIRNGDYGPRLKTQCCSHTQDPLSGPRICSWERRLNAAKACPALDVDSDQCKSAQARNLAQDLRLREVRPRRILALGNKRRSKRIIGNTRQDAWAFGFHGSRRPRRQRWRRRRFLCCLLRVDTSSLTRLDERWRHRQRSTRGFHDYVAVLRAHRVERNCR